MVELAVSPSLSLLKRFEALYQDFSALNLDALATVYSSEVVFKDPVHEIQGIAALRQYFEGIGANLAECRFEFEQQAQGPGHGFYRWRMHYAHPRLAAGRTLALDGATYLEFDDRVTLHQDYYDMGAMLYEHIPVMGLMVCKLKQRLQG